MQLHVLGSAAGGGVPQWNCGCPNCTAAREERLPRRTQASLAASADGTAWVLFNASTDIRSQIERVPALRPSAPRATPIAAVFLTDANIDHAAGVLDFRQSDRVDVYSTATVRDVMLANPMLAPFARAPKTWTAVGDAGVTVAGLRVAPVVVPGLLPAYAGGAAADGAAVGYRIEDAAGAVAVYAPVFSAVSEELAQACAGADIAFFDGSFWSDDELIAMGLANRTARAMGHAPLEGPDGSLEAIRRCGCKRAYLTHVNNSNPVLDPSSPQSHVMRAAGIMLAGDGDSFEIAGARAGARARG
jgi:pyrroloquinoline quinone biosynthesis protein B